LHILSDLIKQAFLHTALVRCTSVAQTKGHSDIAISPMRGNERSFYLIFLFQGNLVETGIRIQEGQQLTPSS
jgi:hypothetical protein